MREAKSVAQIIDAVGVTALARAFGHENVSTVSSWKLRGSVPVEHWRRLVEAYADAGHGPLSFEEIADACAARKVAAA